MGNLRTLKVYCASRKEARDQNLKTPLNRSFFSLNSENSINPGMCTGYNERRIMRSHCYAIKKVRGLKNMVYSGMGEGGDPGGPCQGIPSPKEPDTHR